jgi:beta-lactamase regulating signal transducer with metallopeptidase domain
MTAAILSNAMTANPLNWISPNTMHALGWALLHFVWQGAALAAIAAAAMALVQRPSARYAIGLIVLALMLLSPVATYFFYAQQHRSPAAPTMSTPLAAAARPIARGSTAAGGATPWTRGARSLDAFPWLVEAWLIGVALFSLRSAGGFVLLERERRRKSGSVTEQILEVCLALQHQLEINRAIEYCETAFLEAPAVIGWFRPIVLLPVSVLTGLSDEQLRMVIAHELAHIQRLDAFVNVFQVSVETLLFYHPVVWWLNKRVRAERELCCDEIAVTVCGDAVEYARALTLMEEWRSAPALAMAANRGPISERILHLLGLNASRGGIRKIGFAGSILFLATALVAGNALLGMAHPRPNVFSSSTPIGPLIHPAAVLAQTAPQAQPAPQSAATPAAKPSAAQTPQPASRPISAQSYIDGMKSAGMGDLSADQLIELKIQGVTPEYIQQMHELGFHPDADSIVGMKVQGVTPEYVKELRALGFNPDADEIVGMKVQGVTADYVSGLKAVGIQGDADQIVGLKVQGVTPEYVKELRALRLKFDSDGVVGMKVQGVTPEYVRDMQALGLKLDADEVVGMKVQGVTPGYVKGLRDQGLNPDPDDIVGMKVQGVTPEYMRDVRALGLNPSADELVGMKVQGVTPEFIKALQSAGFKPSVDDVIGAKVQGVTPEFIDLARKHGFQNLSIDKLIQLKHLGILENQGEI